ncbi:MAG: hypothetical protein ACRD1N_00380 [Terriglobia bacterium]
MLALARAAETFSCRPSEMLRSLDYDPSGTLALQIDLAAAVALWSNRRGVSAEAGEREERW